MTSQEAVDLIKPQNDATFVLDYVILRLNHNALKVGYAFPKAPPPGVMIFSRSPLQIFN